MDLVLIILVLLILFGGGGGYYYGGPAVGGGIGGLLLLTGQTRLLEKHPVLDASIRLRLPYIEPLNLLQVELLKRHRAGESDPRVREGIQLSINAIATALRNSG